MIAYLLVRLLWWRYQRHSGLKTRPLTLLAQLKKIRLVRVVELTGKAERPGLHYHFEDMEQELKEIGKLTQTFLTV